MISDLHRKVSKALTGMGLEHECEVMTEDGLFSVDILLRASRIVVEVDGPSHYTFNTQQRLGEPARPAFPGSSLHLWPFETHQTGVHGPDPARCNGGVSALVPKLALAASSG